MRAGEPRLWSDQERRAVPRFWRTLALALIFAAVLLAALAMLDARLRPPILGGVDLEKELLEASVRNHILSAENAQLKSNLTKTQQQAQVDQVAQAELNKTLGQLQDENAHLKEEISFFRKITGAGKAPEGLSVQSFRIERDGAQNEYRFHLLLVQGGARDREFVGRAQLSIVAQKDGVATTLSLPESDKPGAGYDVNVRYYQRIEGRFKTEPGAVLKSAQLRVTEKSTGQVRLTRSLALS